mmetsp:Transcript_5895/g.17717  ORF Transcript_5895/g.17717 Transcript_5895/m.17717 type:complete len:455 (+) Transcript_5895:137-1501(+)
MTSYGAVFPYMQSVAAFRVLLEAFELMLTLRQRKNYQTKEITPEMRNLVTQERFLKAQAYGKDRADFGIVSSVFGLCLNLIFYFTYLMPKLWDLSLRIMQRASASLGAKNDIIRTLVFCVLQYVVGLLTSVPFSLYSTFVIEERYGLNRTTAIQFVKDMFLESFVTALIGIPLMIGVWYTVHWAGPMLWLFLWLFLVSVTFFLQLIYPSVIMPLFNKFSPLEQGKLRDDINGLAAKLNFPLKKLFVMDGSKRSSHSNAFFIGIIEKRIVLFDTLLEQTKGHEERVLGVICHELGHWYLNHIKKTVAISAVHLLFITWLFGKTTQNTGLFTSFGFQDTPYLIGLLLFSEIYSPVESVIGFGMNWLSRKFEYEADDFAKSMKFEKELAEALVVLNDENLSNMNPDPLYSLYHNSHPTLIERLKAIGVRPKMVLSSTQENPASDTQAPLNFDEKKDK